MQADARPAIDSRSTLVSHNVTAEEIDRMPKGRSFQSLAMTAPSVNSGEIEGGFQVNGASGAEAFTVDGVVTNSLINGSSRQNTVFEHLQEVQVKTTGIAAEYGGALGGVISAVTKSGGNTFRGEAHYLYEGSGLSAGPIERLVLDPSDDVTVSYEQDTKAPDHRNEIGGSLGGPIVKDKLFFFGSYSPRFTRAPTTTASRTARRTARSSAARPDAAVRQGDLQRQPHHGVGLGALRRRRRRHAARLQRRRPEHHHRLAGGERRQPGPRLRADADQHQRQRRHRVSNSSFLSARGGYFLDNYNDTGIPDTTNYIYQRTSVGLGGPGQPAGPDRHAEHAARADRRPGRHHPAASSTWTTTTRSTRPATTRSRPASATRTRSTTRSRPTRAAT